MDHPLLDASSTNVINFLSIWLSLRGGGVYYIHFFYKDKDIQGFILRLLEQQRGFVIEMVESSRTSKCHFNSRSFESDHLILWSWWRIEYLSWISDFWEGKFPLFPPYLSISNIPFFVRISYSDCGLVKVSGSGDRGEGAWNWRSS